MKDVPESIQLLIGGIIGFMSICVAIILITYLLYIYDKCHSILKYLYNKIKHKK